MGTFDTVFVEYGVKQRPDELEHGFQTKDLDCALRTYRIHRTGHITADESEEPDEDGWSSRCTDLHVDFSGDIILRSNSRVLRATCRCGRVVKITDETHP